MEERRFGAERSRLLLRAAVAGAAALVVVIVMLASCSKRIDAAHVGIRIRLAGSARGVDDIPMVTGWVFYNALTEQIVEFPTSVQSVVWTKDPHEGKPIDESITFTSREGVNINADVGLSFHIEPHMAPHLYLRFRKPNLLELADGYIRNAMRESFNVAASELPVQEIYGVGKPKMIAEATRTLREQLGKDGIVIDQLTINGALRLPETVATAINRAMEATQLAIQAENRVRQVKAEAEQAVTKAEGEASAARAHARGDADARLITAKAEAKANLVLRYSTTGSVLQYRALERWNGKLPLMHGGGTLPLLVFDAKVGAPNAQDEKKLEALLREDEEPKKEPSKPAAEPEAPATKQDVPAPPAAAAP